MTVNVDGPTLAGAPRCRHLRVVPTTPIEGSSTTPSKGFPDCRSLTGDNRRAAPDRIAGVGVDTLRVGGPVLGVRNGAPGWRVTTELTEAGVREECRLRRLPSGAMLDVRSGSAWVEGSVPKVLRGVNFPAASVVEAQGVGHGWLEEASEFVTFDGSEPKLHRLDVVRDFLEVPNISGVLSDLATLPGSDSRQKRALYRDPQRGAAETVSVFTRHSGGGRLYDKGAESGSIASGVLRFEGEERTRSLLRGSAEVFSDLTDSKAEALARARWEWCRFGASLRPIDELEELIMSGPGRLSDRAALAWITRRIAEGGRVPWPSRDSRWYWAKKLRNLGHGSVGEVVYLLDFDLGVIAA